TTRVTRVDCCNTNPKRQRGRAYRPAWASAPSQHEDVQRRAPTLPTRAIPVLLHNPAESGQGGQDDQECHQISISARRPIDLDLVRLFATFGIPTPRPILAP